MCKICGKSTRVDQQKPTHQDQRIPRHFGFTLPHNLIPQQNTSETKAGFSNRPVSPPSSVGSRTVSSFFVLHFVELFQGNEPWIGVQIWNMSSMFTNMIWKKTSRCQQSKMAINMRCVWSSRTITKEKWTYVKCRWFCSAASPKKSYLAKDI